METIKSELALHEARIEASKLTKGKQRAISLMESDGAFSLVEGEQKNAYAIYKNGAPQKLSAPVQATERAVTKQIAKTSKAPVIAVIKDEEEPEVKSVKKSEVKNQSIKTKKSETMKTTKKTSTIQKMSTAVKKQAAKKVAKKEGKKTAGVPNLPMLAVVEFIKAKARSINEIKGWLKKGGKMESTIYAQINRLKNSPQLVISGETVKFKK